jgi:hypothetical protein
MFLQEGRYVSEYTFREKETLKESDERKDERKEWLRC